MSVIRRELITRSEVLVGCNNQLAWFSHSTFKTGSEHDSSQALTGVTINFAVEFSCAIIAH